MMTPWKRPPLEKLRHGTWGMLHADDVGSYSRSADRLDRKMAVIVIARQEFGCTVSESKIESICPWVVPDCGENASHIEAAGRRFRQMVKIVDLVGAVSVDANISLISIATSALCGQAQEVHFLNLRSAQRPSTSRNPVARSEGGGSYTV